jgi:ABC-2 type transport system ATP-binding protein
MTGRGYLEFMAGLAVTENSDEKSKFAGEIPGLGSRLKDKIKTYSKGMVRKLLLARAIMTKPRLAILDEPTSGLDVINAVEIRKIIKKFAKEEGMAVLLSSHNMLEIEFLSDRVGIINQGQILAIGTPEELKQKHNAQNLEEVFVHLVTNM